MASQQQGETSKSLESLDGEASLSPENKEGKKRRFQPFRAVKKLFSRKKSSKDESASMKSKSTSELSTVQGTSVEPGSLAPLEGATRSVSAESIFSQKRKESDLQGMKESARSVEHINRRDFTSPGKSMSQDSDGSLFGMDSSENEDEFFGSWTPSRLVEGEHRGDVNLDVISSNTSLNVTAAKHRISVANKARRVSSKHRRTSTAASRTPLSKVEEATKADQPAPPATEKLETTVKTPETVKIQEPAKTPEPVLQKDVDVVKAAEKNESKEVRFLVETKEVVKEQKSNADTAGVVLRKKRDDGERDISKRRTLSETNPSESSLSLSGDKAKRASSYESRSWETLGTSPKESTGSNENVSEFAAAFNKMRKRSSRRREELEFEPGVDVVSPASKPAQRKTSTDESSKTTSITYNASSVAKTVKTEIKKPDTPKVTSAAAPFKEEKASNFRTENKPVEVQKTNVSRDKETQSSVKPSDIKKAPTVETLKKEENTVIKPSVSSLKSSFQLNVTSSDNDPSAYKKTTPTQKPKWRSKTLPEQPVSMETLSPEKAETPKSDDVSLKKASSQNLDKPQQAVSVTKKPVSELVRHHSARPEPKKLDKGETGAGDKQEPEWVLLIRKRKQQEKEEDSVDKGHKGEKEKKESVNLSVKNSSENIQKTEIADATTVKEKISSPVTDEAQTADKIKIDKMKESCTDQKDESNNKTTTVPATSNQQNVLSEKISELSTPMKKVEEVKLESSPTSKKFDSEVILDEGKPTTTTTSRKDKPSKRQSVRDMIKSYQNLQVT